MSCYPGLVVVALLLPFACAAADPEPRSIVVLPFDFIDSSLLAELTKGSLPDDLARVERTTAQAREIVDAQPEFELVPIGQADERLAQALDRNLYLYRCNGCALDVAHAAGAELVMAGWIQKVSNLILNVNAVIREADTGRDLAGASIDMRGNTDESWRRATARLVGELIMTSYAATMEKLASEENAEAEPPHPPLLHRGPLQRPRAALDPARQLPL